MKNLFSWGKRKLVTLFFILILMISILYFSAFMLNYYIQQQKSFILSSASETLQSDIQAQGISMTVSHFQPVLQLSGVQISSKQPGSEALSIDKIQVGLAWFDFLYRHQIEITSIELSGLAIQLDQKSDYQWEVNHREDWRVTVPFSENSNQAFVLPPVLSQLSRVQLSDLHINVSGLNQLKRSFNVKNVAWYRFRHSNELNAELSLDELPNSLVSLNMNLTGDLSNSSSWDIVLMGHTRALPLSFLPAKLQLQNITLTNGLINSQFSLHWSGNMIKQIESQVMLTNVDVLSSQTSQSYHLSELGGYFVLDRRNNNSLDLSCEGCVIALKNQRIPMGQLKLSLMLDKENKWKLINLTFDHIDLDQLRAYQQEWLNYLPVDAKLFWTQLKPSGELSNLSFLSSIDDSLEKSTLSFQFKNMALNPWGKWPGFSHLSGSYLQSNDNVEAHLNGKDLNFVYPKLFRKNLLIDKYNADIKIQRGADQSVINIEAAHLDNRDLQGNVSGTINVTKSSPVVDLKAQFQVKQMRALSKYLTMPLFSVDLEAWLNQAFLAGQVTTGQAILKGNLDDFPFSTKSNNGEFQVNADFQNATLQYAPHWPHLENANGRINFNKNRMDIFLDHGVINRMPVSRVTATIPALDDALNPMLTVNWGEPVNTNLSDARDFILRSPLKETVGKSIDPIKMNGPAKLNLVLKIPLQHVSDLKLNGDILFADSSLSIPDYQINLSQLEGKLQFSERDLKSDSIHGQLLNEPISASLFSQFDASSKKNEPLFTVKWKTILDSKSLGQWFPHQYLEQLNGQFHLGGELNAYSMDKMDILLESTLEGLSIHDLAGITKNKSDQKPFSIAVSTYQDLYTVKANYDGSKGGLFWLKQKDKQYQLLGAHLFVDQAIQAVPSISGLAISATLDNLDDELIQRFMNQKGQTLFSGLSLALLDVRIAKLKYSGIKLNDAHIVAKQSQNNWMLQLSSPQLEGAFTIPVNNPSKGMITADVSRFNYIPDHSFSKSPNLINVKILPSLSIKIRELQYNGRSIGALTFNANATLRGLKITKCDITSPVFQLRSSGAWSTSTAGQETQLSGHLNSSHITQFLNLFDVSASNLDVAQGSLNFDLTWRNPIFMPSLNSLSGRAVVRLEKGRIENDTAASGVKMGFGRMLSIFSLQTIPRRLSLDFSDLFEKGYSFDYMTGHFALENGEAYTSDLKFDGPLAKVSIDGKIGLSNQTYQFLLTVKPYVTSSIPVAAAIVGGPVAGVAAYAVNSVIGSTVSEASENVYLVTGTWANPKWEAVSKSRIKH